VDVVMKFHPRGLLALAAVAAVWLLALDMRWGIAAILAATAIDAYSFVTPFIGRPLRDDKRNGSPHQ
jgi:hypothetical protein